MSVVPKLVLLKKKYSALAADDEKEFGTRATDVARKTMNMLEKRGQA